MASIGSPGSTTRPRSTDALTGPRQIGFRLPRAPRRHSASVVGWAVWDSDDAASRRAELEPSTEGDAYAMGVSLSKGGNVSLTKAAPNLISIGVGLGWDVRSTAGHDFDLDASALALGENHKVLGDDYFVFFNNLKSPDGSIEHQGDNLTGSHAASGCAARPAARRRACRDRAGRPAPRPDRPGPGPHRGRQPEGERVVTEATLVVPGPQHVDRLVPVGVGHPQPVRAAPPVAGIAGHGPEYLQACPAARTTYSQATFRAGRRTAELTDRRTRLRTMSAAPDYSPGPDRSTRWPAAGRVPGAGTAGGPGRWRCSATTPPAGCATTRGGCW